MRSEGSRTGDWAEELGRTGRYSWVLIKHVAEEGCDWCFKNELKEEPIRGQQDQVRGYCSLPGGT